MARAYFRIVGLDGDGKTTETAFQPTGLKVKGVTGWAASYDPKDPTRAFVLVEADDKVFTTLARNAAITPIATLTVLREAVDPITVASVAVLTDEHIVNMVDIYEQTIVGDWKVGA